MTDYTKLVVALRNNDWSDACPCCDEAMCKDADCIIFQAADAIEALQAGLPKRGKWVREMNVYDEPFYHCSACGECFDSNRDDTYGIFNYCPNCGAKMEVQE